MSQLNLNFPINKTTKKYRSIIAEGNEGFVLRKSRRFGLLWMLIGLALSGLVVLMIMDDFSRGEKLIGIFTVVLFFPTVSLLLYGLRSLFFPKISANYKSNYLGLMNTIRHNTGYPQKLYVPEQWEIPMKDYTQETLEGILRLVGGWGQDNICFICNRAILTSRNAQLIDASLFNLNENGITIIPIGTENGTTKAYADLCSIIPTKSIKGIHFYPASLSPQKQDVMELCIDYDEYTWDTYDRGTKPLFDLTMAYHVQRRIDGAPFHECNVNQLYQLHGSPSRLNNKNSKIGV